MATSDNLLPYFSTALFKCPWVYVATDGERAFYEGFVASMGIRLTDEDIACLDRMYG